MGALWGRSHVEARVASRLYPLFIMMKPAIEVAVGPSRSPRSSGRPTISVVVASSATLDLLSASLRALEARCARVSAQLIVVRACPDSELEELRASMPEARFLFAPPGATHRELRRLGMAQAAGDIVAFTSDHQVIDDAWAAVLLHAAPDSSETVQEAPRPL